MIFFDVVGRNGLDFALHDLADFFFEGHAGEELFDVLFSGGITDGAFEFWPAFDADFLRYGWGNVLVGAACQGD